MLCGELFTLECCAYLDVIACAIIYTVVITAKLREIYFYILSRDLYLDTD
jgi:hypothetical protein